MKTFEVTFPNGERQIHEANYYRETVEAGTKVLELYKTVSNYDSQSKPFLYLTGYLTVKEVVEIDSNITISELYKSGKKCTFYFGKLYEYISDCCNSCKEGNECESK